MLGLPLSLPTLFMHLRQGLPLNVELSVLASLIWPGHLQNLLVSTLPPVLGLQGHVAMPNFYVGAGHLNSGLNACTSVLTSESFSCPECTFQICLHM